MSTTALPSSASTLAAVKPRQAPLAVIIAAWAVPVMVAGGFAFFAYLPLAVVVIGVLFDPRSRRALGWWTAPLASPGSFPSASGRPARTRPRA